MPTPHCCVATKGLPRFAIVTDGPSDLQLFLAAEVENGSVEWSLQLALGSPQESDA